MPLVQPVIVPFEGDAKDLERKIDALNRDFDKFAAHTKSANQQVANSTKTVSMGFTEFRSTYSTILDVARGGQQVWQETGQKFVDYAARVRDVSRSLGASAEESSRLVQVADDVGISYQSLTTSLKLAQKDGIDPSVEGLAKLSDKYLSLEPGVKRTQFLLDAFGKSGAEMGKLMEQGGNGIREMSGAIDDSMILTQKALDQARDFEIAQDAMNDTWDAFTYQVAPPLVSVVTDVINHYRDISTSLEENGYWYTLTHQLALDDISAKREESDAALRASESNNEFSGALEDNADALDGNKEAVEAAKDALKDYEEQLEAVSQANEDLESMSRTIAKDQRKYEDDHKDAVDEVAKLEDELAEAREKYSEDFVANAKKAGFAQKDLNDAIKKYGANSEEAFNAREKLNNIKEAQDTSFEGLDETFAKFEEAQGAVTDLEVAWHEAANNMIYDMVLVGVSVGGLLDSEQKALDEYAVKAGIKTQADIDEANRRRDIADATIAGILQSEDVLAEQRKIDAETLRLTEAQTSAESLASAAEQVNAINGVSASIDSATQSYMAMAAAAYKAAAAAKSIPGAGTSGGGSAGSGTTVPPADSGGAGIAGQPYMIGTGAQPEIFVPTTNGTFIPNADKKGMIGGVTYNIVVNNPKKETAENSIRRSMKLANYTGNFA